MNVWNNWAKQQAWFAYDPNEQTAPIPFSWWIKQNKPYLEEKLVKPYKDQSDEELLKRSPPFRFYGILNDWDKDYSSVADFDLYVQRETLDVGQLIFVPEAKQVTNARSDRYACFVKTLVRRIKVVTTKINDPDNRFLLEYLHPNENEWEYQMLLDDHNRNADYSDHVRQYYVEMLTSN